MSLRLQGVLGNFSKDPDDHLWVGSQSTSIGVFGTSRDQYGVVRTIGYATSGSIGLIARFNEFSNGSKQYYQFMLNPDGDYCTLEEVNVSTNWSTPTVLQSRKNVFGANESTYISFTVTAVNDSQDRLQGFVQDVGIIDYIGSLTLSSGKQGVISVAGEARFDRNTVIGEEIDYYCSVQDVKNLIKGLELTAVTDEGELMALISRASQKINQKTDSVFGRLKKIVSERHQGGGEESIIIEHAPLKILSKILLYNYNNALVDTLIPGNDTFDNLIIEKVTGEITMPAKSTTLTPIYGVGIHPVEGRDQYTYKEYDYSQFWGVGRRNIVVNYLYGHDDVPHNVWDACRKMVGIEVLTKIGNYNTKGASAIRLGDAYEDYRGKMPFSGTILKWERDIERNLGEYNVFRMESI